MEVVHKNDAAPGNGDIKTKSEYSDCCGGLQINLPVVSSLVHINDADPAIKQITKSAKSFKNEIGDLNYIHVASVGRKMREYEGLLWEKVVFEDRVKFQCLICKKVLCHFWSYRNHMFLHLQIFPFKCFACDKKYTNKRSFSLHTKNKHSKLLMRFNAGHWLK